MLSQRSATLGVELSRAGVLDVKHGIVVLLVVHFGREDAQHCLVWHKLVAADLVARHIFSYVEDLLEGVLLHPIPQLRLDDIHCREDPLYSSVAEWQQ